MVIRSPDQRATQGGYAALDDRMLVLDFQAGQVEAFVEIHRRYGALARHVCMRFLPNQADADEAFQETMIRVFQGLYRFNGRYALRPWIARIAKNVSLDILRGHARRPYEAELPADEDLAAPADEADLIVERLVQRDTVLAILADLPETHRRALVLREIDGASHREIAHELEITPSQAKALIHRARGSFRKGWLEKAIGEGGLRAIAFLPLLWLARVGGGIRRIGDRVGFAAGHATQTAQAAASEAITSTVTAAAPASASLGERVVAAGMTLLVAGGVTVGAAKVVQDRNRPEPAQVAAAAAAVAGAPGATAEPAEEVAPSPVAPRPIRDETQIGPVAVEPEPSVEPSPSVDPSVEPSVEPSPSVDPSVEPTPSEGPPVAVFPPAPEWEGLFEVVWSSDDECGCGPGVALATSAATGGLLEEEGVLTANQGIQGAAVDVDGDAAWALEANYSVELTQKGGSLQLAFVLVRDGVRTYYAGSASVTEVIGTPGDGEPMIYALSGSYGLAAGSEETSPIRTSGSFRVRLGVWADGLTVYGAQIQLRG